VALFPQRSEITMKCGLYIAGVALLGDHINRWGAPTELIKAIQDFAKTIAKAR
jgi:hypothetical protein